MTSSPRLQRLLITADTVGGVWTYALDLARAMGTRGVKVLLASSGPTPSPAQRDEARRLSNVFWVHRCGALEWMDDPWRDVDATGEWLLDWEKRFEPDLIHLNEYSAAALPWKAPVLVGAHSCVLSWWRAVKGEAAPGRYDEYRERVRRGLDSASLVVAPTQAMLDELCREYHWHGSTSVIHNGRTFVPCVDSKLPVIFSAGRLWDEAKNIALLDFIAPELRWPVHVAGKIQEAGVGPCAYRNVVTLGCLDAPQMAETLGQSSIYAAPAWYEPFGLAILEAALSGCALVLADIPSLRELWNGAAIFVSPDDRSGWIQALNELSSNSEKRETLGRRAEEQAGRYSLEAMMREYDAAYATLLERESSLQLETSLWRAA